MHNIYNSHSDFVKVFNKFEYLDFISCNIVLFIIIMLITLIETASTASQQLSSQFNLWASLAFPLVVLVVYSLMKYTIGTDLKQIKKLDFFAELPIDILSVGATLILSYHISNSGQEFVAAKAQTFLVITLLIALIECVLRRYSIQWQESPNENIRKRSLGVIASLWLFSIGWLIFIYNIQ